LEKKPLNEEEYNSLCGSDEKSRKFLSINVFALNSDGLYDFDSKVVENAVRDKLLSC
jgi:hypothetical protein